ncbi:MAG: tetratricopeptide (TPR) repeat protein [Neolewinella sp.]|jgi:tetratricopeptide (TPR) repeat protein
MRWLLFYLMFSFFVVPLTAQSDDYRSATSAAYAALQDGRPRKAIKLYKKAFKEETVTTLDLLRVIVAATEARKTYLVAELLDEGFQTNPLALVLIFNDQPEFRKYHDQPLGAQIRRQAILTLRSDQKSAYRPLIQKGKYQLESEAYAFNALLAGMLLRRGEYKKALDYYQRTFQISDDDANSLLRAGMAAAMARRPEEAHVYIDKAFTVWPDYAMTYVRLHNDFKPALEDAVFQSELAQAININFPGFDPELTAEIDAIWTEYLRFRKHNPNPKYQYPLEDQAAYPIISVPELLAHKEELTKRTYDKLKVVFDRVGIPSLELIADRAVLPLVMMRGAPTAFLDEYWNDLLTACRDDVLATSGFRSTLAFAYDEACVREGKRQRYGSLILWDKEMMGREPIDYYPVEDPENLAERRQEIGLKPLEEFFKGFGATFSVREQLQYEGFPKGFLVHYSPYNAYDIKQPRSRTTIVAPVKTRN